MNITEVKVRLANRGDRKLRAYCTVTIDNSFVIRDLKVIQGLKGPFVAMPSRKLTDKCLRCGTKNPLKANYCNECGSRLSGTRVFRDKQGRVKLHTDIVHPINQETRDLFQKKIIEAYKAESSRSTQPGYKPRQDVSEPPEKGEEAPPDAEKK